MYPVHIYIYIHVTSQGIHATRARIHVGGVFFSHQVWLWKGVIIDIMDEYRGVVPSTFQVVYTGIYWGLPKPCNGGIISSLKLTVRRKLMVGRRSFPFGIRPIFRGELLGRVPSRELTYPG